MESENLEPRVAALEGQVRDLTRRVQGSEQDAAAARVLAGAADRDVSEIRGDIRQFRQAVAGSFNAVREDYVDLREDFKVLRDDFKVLRGEFDVLRGEFGVLRDHVDRGFMEMRGKFDAAAAGQQQIVDLLKAIDTDRGQGRAE